MGQIEDLKKELQGLQVRKKDDQEVKKLKAQIRSHKFGATIPGKVFNKIADAGDIGIRATTKFLSQPNPSQVSGKKKKKTPARMSVEEMMRRLPQ